MFGLPLLRGSTRDHARKRYVHHVLLCEHRCPTEYREPLLPADRQGNPIPTGTIRLGPSMSITVWVPTPTRRPMALDFTRMFGRHPRVSRTLQDTEHAWRGQ